MSGGGLAYHLRQNKAIDRNLFIDLLSRVGRVRNISDYEYIGFGGPFLEEYKALHAVLRIKRMHSIEYSENTYRRQLFNKPAGFISLNKMESSEFFRQHSFSENGNIVWLDYTNPRELNSQLQEFSQVVGDLGCYDIAKITLNADPETLGCKNEKPNEMPEKRLGKLKELIPEYIPPDLTGKDLTSGNYPRTLQRCVQASLGKLSSRETGRYFHVLSSFVYRDGQQMLTITGIVFNAADDPIANQFIKDSRIEHWPFANLKWESPRRISVPALSAKERMKLDESLPLDGDDATIMATLKSQLSYVPGEEADVAELVNYARYYRSYPHFSRVIL